MNDYIGNEYGRGKYILTDLKAKLKADRQKWDEKSIGYEHSSKCLGAMTEIDEILKWLAKEYECVTE